MKKLQLHTYLESVLDSHDGLIANSYSWPPDSTTKNPTRRTDKRKVLLYYLMGPVIFQL